MYKRDSSIDIFKGLLVIGMIFAHVISLFTDRNQYIIPKNIVIFIDCITFSGFVFCFGYAHRIAYLSKNLGDVYKRIILNAFKAYVAYLVSGISYKILIEKIDFTLLNVIKIATFQTVPILSEFLVTFSLLSIFTLVAFKPLKYLLENKLLFWFVCIFLLLTTFLPPDLAKVNQVGLLIGSNKFGSFPLLQYLPLFLLGMYFSKNNVVFNVKYLIGSFICSLLPLLQYFYKGILPSRFPPSLLWIISSLFFLYCYFLISQHIKNEQIELIGRNVMFYLLMSNILMFAIRGTDKYFLSPDPFAMKSLLASILLTVLISYMAKLISKQKAK